MTKRTFLILHLSSFIFLWTACASQATQSTPQPGNLISYLTATQASLPTPEGLVPLTTPLPSPTPFTYTIKAGDSMSVIANKFGVKLDDLQAANPEISPNAMSVGQVLKIPSNPDNPSGEPTPTPAPFVIQQIACYPTADKGMWCFVLAYNDSPDFMENVSAQVTLVDSNNNLIASHVTACANDVIAAASRSEATSAGDRRRSRGVRSRSGGPLELRVAKFVPLSPTELGRVAAHAFRKGVPSRGAVGPGGRFLVRGERQIARRRSEPQLERPARRSFGRARSPASRTAG
jgi:LysM repeat protein